MNNLQSNLCVTPCGLGKVVLMQAVSVARNIAQLSQPLKILLNLCVSLIGLLIMVLFAVTPNDGSGRCTAAAMILHYFLISSFLWMLMEGINMYIRLVKLKQRDAIQSFWKMALAVWLIPGVIVGVTYAASSGSYGPNKNLVLCRIHGLAFEISLFSLIVAILALNLVVYCCVIRRLYLSHSTVKISVSEAGSLGAIENTEKSAKKRALVRSMTFATLLGLTWITGLFMFDNASLPVQYLFTVAVSLQGLSIFLLQCVANPDIRKRWSGLFERTKSLRRRSSNNGESDIALASNRISSSSSETAMMSSNPKNTNKNFLQALSPSPAVKSPMSPKHLSCEVHENGILPEVSNPLHRDHTPTTEADQGSDCSNE